MKDEQQGAFAHVPAGLARFILGIESQKQFLVWLQQQPLDHEQQEQVIERLIHQARSTGEATVTLAELLELRHHYNSLRGNQP